jgi:hypothetical protein
VCSFGPVFSLEQIDGIMVIILLSIYKFAFQNHFLGYSFDCAKFESDLDKLKKTLNLECNPHPLYDPEDSELNKRQQAEKHRREHIKMN